MRAAPAVLFVDDDANIVAGMRRQTRAKRNSWSLHFALGGPEAIEIIRAQVVDVLVCDMRMPQVDGAAVLAATAAAHPASVRIILSGEADLEATYSTVGVSHGFRPKPCDPEVIVRRIDEILAMRKMCGGSAALEALATRLPSPPEVIARLDAALTDDAADLDQVVDIARSDPALATRILHLVNSAYFAQAFATSDLDLAVRSLGPEPLRGLHKRGRLVSEATEEDAEAVRVIARGAAALAGSCANGDDPAERAFQYSAHLLTAIDALLRVTARGGAGDMTNRYASGYVACLFGLPARLIEVVSDFTEAHVALALDSEAA